MRSVTSNYIANSLSGVGQTNFMARILSDKFNSNSGHKTVFSIKRNGKGRSSRAFYHMTLYHVINLDAHLNIRDPGMTLAMMSIQ